MICAFFGLVFAVNAYFVEVALSTHTGVVANEPYRKGLDYNNRIAADERQSALGWTDEIRIDETGTRVVAVLTDRDGAPVAGRSLSASFSRPATEKGEMRLSFSEVTPGRYESVLSEAALGGYIIQLDVRATADEAAEPVFRARKRLWRKP
jgi:nitrogen fixation protein FixH